MFTFHWREALEEAGDLHLLDITTREMLSRIGGVSSAGLAAVMRQMRVLSLRQMKNEILRHETVIQL